MSSAKTLSDKIWERHVVRSVAGEHDLLYIDQWSLFLDIKILLKTLFSRRSYSNAH